MESDAKGTGSNGNSTLPVSQLSVEQYPVGTMKFDRQVAGHFFDPIKNRIGVLRGETGRILKSCNKLQEREIAFYDAIENSDDPIYKELSIFVPKYHGTLETIYQNKPIKFMVFDDLTEGIVEPCVMDIKIGKRTWHPLAGPEKREAEDRKYAASKKAYGFCIPGFQVYNVTTGEFQKYDKDYGKKLDAEGVVSALRIFLNAEPDKLPYRELVVNLLSYLWKILAFIRHQKKLRFYASSLLMTYDAHRLRSNMRSEKSKEIKLRGMETRNRAFSSSDTGLSGHLTTDGPCLESTAKNFSVVVTNPPSSMLLKTNRIRAIDRLHKLRRSASLTGCDFPRNSPPPSPKPETKIERSGSFGRGINDDFSPLCRTHSYTNNYDRDMMEIRDAYAALLEKLTGKDRTSQNWVRVNMIDFANVAEAEDDSIDVNYLQGIENLIQILETFLG